MMTNKQLPTLSLLLLIYSTVYCIIFSVVSHQSFYSEKHGTVIKYRGHYRLQMQNINQQDKVACSEEKLGLWGWTVCTTSHCIDAARKCALIKLKSKNKKSDKFIQNSGQRDIIAIGLMV
jgi:hypothetical protein